jgi:hypothetical protein
MPTVSPRRSFFESLWHHSPARTAKTRAAITQSAPARTAEAKSSNERATQGRAAAPASKPAATSTRHKHVPWIVREAIVAVGLGIIALTTLTHFTTVVPIAESLQGLIFQWYFAMETFWQPLVTSYGFAHSSYTSAALTCAAGLLVVAIGSRIASWLSRTPAIDAPSGWRLPSLVVIVGLVAGYVLAYAGSLTELAGGPSASRMDTIVELAAILGAGYVISSTIGGNAFHLRMPAVALAVLAAFGVNQWLLTP